MKRLRWLSVPIGCAVLASGCAIGGTAMDDLAGDPDDADPWQVAIPANVGPGGKEGLLMRIDDVDAVYVDGLGVLPGEFGGHRIAFENVAIPTALVDSPPAYLHYLDHVNGHFRIIIGSTSSAGAAVDGDDFQAALEQDLFIGFRNADGATLATRMRGDDTEQYEWAAEDSAAANAFFAGTGTVRDIDILFGRSSMR